MPLHAKCLIGNSLSGDYFNPGNLPTHVKVRGGQVIQVRERPDCSLWAEGYWLGVWYRYERAGLGAPWVRMR